MTGAPLNALGMGKATSELFFCSLRLFCPAKNKKQQNNTKMKVTAVHSKYKGFLNIFVPTYVLIYFVNRKPFSVPRLFFLRLKNQRWICMTENTESFQTDRAAQGNVWLTIQNHSIINHSMAKSCVFIWIMKLWQFNFQINCQFPWKNN